MAVFIPAVNVLKLSVIQSLASQAIVNTFHIQLTAGTLTPTTAAGAADAFATWWTENVLPLQSNQLHFSHVDWVDLSTQTSPSGRTGEAGSLENGGVSSPSLPSNAALVVTVRTSRRGRSYRGRIYLAGIPLNQQDNAVFVDSDYANSVQAAFLTMLSSSPWEDFGPVVVSYQHNKVTTNPAHAEPVTAFDVNAAIDSQRRRLQGRGR